VANVAKLYLTDTGRNAITKLVSMTAGLLYFSSLVWDKSTIKSLTSDLNLYSA
jgi:hypothetical protein